MQKEAEGARRNKENVIGLESCLQAQNWIGHEIWMQEDGLGGNENNPESKAALSHQDLRTNAPGSPREVG